jgi:hypothetical protein
MADHDFRPGRVQAVVGQQLRAQMADRPEVELRHPAVNAAGLVRQRRGALLLWGELPEGRKLLREHLHLRITPGG